MKLSISNIAWNAEDNERVYALMKQYGYTGLEIAPTKIFPENPYEKFTEAEQWAENLRQQYGFAVSSIQSIWYGRQENIFATEQEREILLLYTQKAIDFANRLGCHNLVFGCPRNRDLPLGADPKTAIPFFRGLGDYAAARNTVLSMEANPPIYNTNYINDTESAVALVKEVASAGFKLNLDIGTMIQNAEKVELLEKNVHLVNHVHISEPGLGVILERRIHKNLFALLKQERYSGFVSIEMGLQENTEKIEQALRYVMKLCDEN